MVTAVLMAACSPDNFVSLFNGRDLYHWMMPGENKGFRVKDGNLYTEVFDGSNIFTVDEYGNFILRFEYYLSGTGNSGVLLRCRPDNPWGTGVEVQLLAPWDPPSDDLHRTGSVYGYIAVKNRPDETPEVWRSMEIKYDRKLISVSIDGQIVTRADIDTVPGMDNKLLKGAIGFQSNHSGPGEYAIFRNIVIRDLDREPGYVAGGFNHHDEGMRNLAHAAAVSIGTPMIEPLAVLMAGDSLPASEGARQVLACIVSDHSSTGTSGAEKRLAVRALKRSIRNDHSVAVTAYLKELLASLQQDV